jgi:K+-transporting ATPase ATPase B chain
MLLTENAIDALVVKPTAASVSWPWVAGEVLRKLAPQVQWKNPVMFVVYIGSILTTLLWIDALIGGRPDAPAGFIVAIALWLWFTVLFANAAEALAEGRGKARQMPCGRRGAASLQRF